MNTDRLRIKADEGMSACVRHCDRSGNGIHTLAASQYDVPRRLKSAWGVDRVWPLYLITGQKKNISVYLCSYQRVSAVKKKTGGKGA